MRFGAAAPNSGATAANAGPTTANAGPTAANAGPTAPNSELTAEVPEPTVEFPEPTAAIPGPRRRQPLGASPLRAPYSSPPPSIAFICAKKFCRSAADSSAVSTSPAVFTFSRSDGISSR